MENENEYQNGERSSVGGCILKVVGTIFFLIIMFVGNSLIRTCTRQQMRQAARESYSNIPAEDLFQKGLKELKSKLPQKVDEVTTCTDVELTSKAYTYIYTVDKSIDFATVDFKVFDSQTKEEIKAKKEKLAVVAKLCKETGRMLCYRYVSERNGAVHTITFLKDELNLLL